MTTENFRHRHNPDGTFDSICPRCYMTVASMEHEAQLTEAEKEHACAPFLAVKDRQADSFVSSIGI
jgi:hypothetical protein